MVIAGFAQTTGEIAGGYGEVSLSGSVALKRLPADKSYSAVRELVCSSAGNHPNVTPITRYTIAADTVGRSGGMVATLVLPRQACDLQTYMNQAISMHDAQKISLDVLNAIYYLHRRGIIHADIKPGNVLVNFADGELRAMLCDTGISMPIREKRHFADVQTCTYRAPEVAFGYCKALKLNQQIDLWSLGIIMYELIANEPAVIWIPGEEDSSKYAENLFGMRTKGDRGQRMRVLSKMTVVGVKSMLLARVAKANPGLVKALKNSAYLEAMAMCLLPNHKKRCSAKLAIELLSNVSPYIPSRDIFAGNLTHPGFTSNMRHTIVCALSSYKCLGRYAEHLFALYANGNNATTEHKYACIYIAACMFSSPSWLMSVCRVRSSSETITNIIDHIRL
jgi:serine/threonine protein kinase